MEFIGADIQSSFLTLGYLFGGTIIGISILVFAVEKRFLALKIVSVFIVLLGFSLAFFELPKASNSKIEKIAQEAKITYGVELSKEDVRNISYPKSEPKADTTRIFGTTREEINDNGEITPDGLTLVWKDNELKLFQLNSEGVRVELPRTG